MVTSDKSSRPVRIQKTLYHNLKALQTIGFPALIVITCLLAKWWHKGADNQSLLFLTQPISTFVSIFSGSRGFFDPEVGFYHKALSITIDKSCAGFNFMIISFGSIFSIRYQSNAPLKTSFLHYFSSVCIAYVITLFANTSRILVSTKSLRLSETFPWLSSHAAHEIIGSFFFISCLLITCLFIYYLKSKNTHAQPS